jgi:hypothetical protein
MKTVEERIGKGLIPEQELELFLNDYTAKNHPYVHCGFMRTVRSGKATLDQLKNFAKEFEHFLRWAPSHFFVLGASCPPDVIPDGRDPRRTLGVNLVEDMGLTVATIPGDHFQKFRRFAYAIGLTAEEMDHSIPSASTNAFNMAYLSCLKSLPYPEGMCFHQVATESIFLLDLVRPLDEAITKYYGVETYSPTAEEESEHAALPRQIVFDWANASPQNQLRAFELFKINYALFSIFMDQFA